MIDSLPYPMANCFEAFLKVEPECVKVIDRAGRILMMNPAGLNILEAASAAQVVGRSMLDFVVPSHHDHLRHFLNELLSRDSVACEFEVIGLKGGHRWLESHMVAMRGADQVEFLSVTRDITKSRMLESAWRNSEERFGLVVENCSDLVAELAADGSFLYVNPSFRFILGYSSEFLVSKSIYNQVHPADSELLRTLMKGDGPSVICRFQHSDGSVVHLDCTCRSYAHSAGHRRIALIARGVEISKKADALRAHAHDFNNQICGIMGNLELARLDIPPGHPAEAALETALRASMRAVAILRERPE